MYVRTVWGKLIKKTYAKKTKFDVYLRFGEDAVYFNKILISDPVIYHFDYCGYNYILNDGSVVNNANVNRKFSEVSQHNNSKAYVEIYKNILNYVNMNLIGNIGNFYAERIVMILRTISFYDKDYLKQNKKILKELAKLSRPYLKGNRLKYVSLFIKHDKLFYAANKTLKLFWGLYYKIKN